MNKKIKKMLLMSLFALGIVGIHSMTSMAQSVENNKIEKSASCQKTQCHCQKPMHMMWYHQHSRPMWHLGLENDKQLSENDARVITKAALLMHGRKDFSVGKITAKDFHDRKFYIIQLIDDKGHVAKNVIMNSATGFIHPVPKEYLDKIQS